MSLSLLFLILKTQHAQRWMVLDASLLVEKIILIF